MKIAIDVSQMCYLGTGVAKYVTELTKALLQAGSPHTFILYAGTLHQRPFFTKLSKTKPWNQATWKIFPLPPKLAGYALNDTSIPFELLTGPVDLIHASDWGQPSAKAKIVTTVHDLVFIKYPETVDPLILATQTRRLKKIVGSSTQIIADSISTKNDLVEIYNIPTSRIDVVYPGISMFYTPQSKQEIERVKTKYNLHVQYIFSLGTQEPRKNIAKLVEVAGGLDIPLVIAGRHGWGEQTQTIGFVPDADLPALYSGAMVFVFPSLYEGFGFPVLESMACGTPVITSNISSLPEVAGEAGILVDPESVDSIRDGIKQALAGRAKLIPLGLKQAKKFSWEATAKQVLEVYEKTAHRD
jgi:glycosyltransferase involved in cell wall biosynthesis